MATRTQPCRICRSDIPTGAKKCTNCGEYQSTLSRIAAGFDLKGILALLPLLTLIYAFLAERLEVPRSELGVTAIACDAQGATLFASNSGNRVALLRAADFAATGDTLGTFDLPEAPDRIFQPGEARTLVLMVNRARNPGGLASFQSLQQEGCRVEIDVTYLTHDQRERKEVTSCGCPSS